MFAIQVSNRYSWGAKPRRSRWKRLPLNPGLSTTSAGVATGKAIDDLLSMADRNVLSFDAVRSCLGRTDNGGPPVEAETEVLMAYFESVFLPASPGPSTSLHKSKGEMLGIVVGRKSLAYRSVSCPEWWSGSADA